MEEASFDFTCPECGEEFHERVEFEDVEEVASHERNDDFEIQYDFKGNVECPVCGHKWEVTGEFWEYPSGVFYNAQLTR